MKKLGTTIFVLLVMLLLVTPTQKPVHEDNDKTHAVNQDAPLQHIQSSINDTGESRNGTQFMSRTITDLNTSILNTYTNPENHNGTINISDYQIPGWTLYNTTIDIGSLSGAPERETVGVDREKWDFEIEKHESLYYTQLAQGFYDQPYNGSLQNYSIYYDTSSYNPENNNPAYFLIRRAYDNDTSNVTSHSVVPPTISSTWHTEYLKVNLTADHEYYLIIDGRALVEYEDKFPEIEWGAEDAAGDFDSYKYTSPSWLSPLREALLNYTYIPWNQTSNRPLLFDASEVSLRANQTPIDGDSVSFETSGNNITLLQFDSNQSVYMGYNLTLWYKKDTTFRSVWNIENSGDITSWNLTSGISYPKTHNIVGKYVNITKMTDWTPSALYNGSSQTNHDNFTAYDDIVTCSNMTNGTWTLTLTAPNYVDAINTYDSADNSLLKREASILLDMDINTTIADSGGNPADTGSTNLTIMHEGEMTWGPSNETVNDGKTYYSWNINETTQDNGTYTLEVYWANGTEAGYLTKEIVVFYPTSLDADLYSIDAYTESNFSIRVQFNDTYNNIGLNGSVATAKYSFDGESNQTMTDHDNGTWTADISTVGRSPGSHTVEVFGEGFAIENQSLTISVELLHDTEPLTVEWSDGNTTTYLEKTTLLVNYSLFDGTSVADARVNVTIDSNTWNLTWNETSELYELTFNGTDDPPGLGTHSLTISAWKSGYEGQTDGDQNLTLLKEPTFLELEWYESNSITYTQSTTLRANFSISNGTPVEDAWISVTIGSDTWNMTWNGTSGFYELVFNGTDDETGLGTYSLSVQASKPKYESQSGSPSDLTIDEEPTDILVTWHPTNVTIDTTEFLNLSVEYTYGGGDVPDDATVNVIMDGKTYDLLWNTSHWIVDIPGNDFPEGVYNASISASRYGYEARSYLTENINITLAPNAFQVFWTPENQNITYIESISLNVTYNHDYSPIENATVRLFLNGTLFCHVPFNESSQTYFKTIPASDITLGTWNATVVANKTGYETKQDTSYLTVNEDTPNVVTSWTSNTTDFITSIDLYVEFYASNGTPITDGGVQVTVDSETYIGQHVSQGNYSVTIGPELEIDNNSLDLQVERYGYTNQYKTLWLDVVRASTILSVNHTSLEVYYDETVDFTIEYSMENSSIIHPANLSFLVNGENHSAVWTGNYWETTLNATLLEVGSHDCVVNVSAYGFVSKQDTFPVQVSSIPTNLEIDGKTWLFVNDSIVLKVEYLDSRTSTRIEDLNHSIVWAGAYDIVQNPNLTYSLTIDSINLHANEYSLEITFSAEGYDSVMETPSIEVRRLPLSLIFDQDMEIYENETMQVAVSVNETYHAELIDFAQVNLTIEGSTYILEYDEASESYRASIWLNSTIEPTDYILDLRASAIDCQTEEEEIELQVLAKAEYALAAELVSQTTVVTEGSALAIRAILEDSNGDPLAGKTIVFYVKMTGTNGETVESTTAVTNDEGRANAGFDIPSETNALEVWARYEGSESEWPTETEALTVEVRPAPSLIEVLISTVRTPQAQLAILVAVLAIVGAVAYTKVIKPRREAGRKTLQKQLEQFRELSTLQHFMAIYTEHGTCVIYFPFTEKHIEPDLISGFISAITSVYSEITGEGGVKGTLEEIHYHGLRLNSYSGRYIIGILILESEMSAILKRRLEFFVEMFESQYDSDLEDWMGRVDCFDPEWVLSNLLSTLDYYWLLPQKIADEKRIRKENKTVLRFLQNNLDEKDEFCIDEILAPLAQELAETEAETLERLLTLQEEGAIEPISVQTLMTRRGLGLSGVEGQAMEPVPEEGIVESSQESEKPETETALPSEEVEEDPQEEMADIEKPTPTETIVVQEAEQAEDTSETEDETEPEEKTYAFLKEVERHLLEEKKKESSEDKQQE